MHFSSSFGYAKLVFPGALYSEFFADIGNSSVHAYLSVSAIDFCGSYF